MTAPIPKPGKSKRAPRSTPLAKAGMHTALKPADKTPGKVRTMARTKAPGRVADAPPAHSVFGRMGQLLGEHIESEFDVVKLVNLGLPSSALESLSDAIDVDYKLIAPESTIRRRLNEKQHFTVDESERLMRMARVTSMAEELFGDRSTASAWLSARANYLPDVEPISPLELSATDSGTRLVEAMILRTAHGVF
ncbi:antitoxin Xre-like helix-turn-helix domain-containing protein [Montanilutibacter psychrotolerans]|nr:antitoxin Xre-like helix-turn-helix domain-containing protein [Lysobacter psychrotolerans]